MSDRGLSSSATAGRAAVTGSGNPPGIVLRRATGVASAAAPSGAAETFVVDADAAALSLLLPAAEAAAAAAALLRLPRLSGLCIRQMTSMYRIPNMATKTNEKKEAATKGMNKKSMRSRSRNEKKKNH